MNKAQVSALLARNPFAVTKAIVLLWSYQTPQERQAKRTTDLNGRGFSIRTNQKDVAYWVRWILALPPNVSNDRMSQEVAKYLQSDPKRYRCLSGRYLEEAREVASYYWRQLDAAAKAKAEAERIPF